MRSQFGDVIGFWLCNGAVLIALASCATKPPPSPPPQALAKPICLPMVSYSQAEQTQAANELQALKPGSELAAFVRDYGALRAANRAVCQ